MWSPGLGAGNQLGAWIQVNRPQSSTVDHLDLVVAADGFHSVPTKLRIQACAAPAANGRCPSDAPSSSVSLPPVADGKRRGATAAVPVRFPAVTGRDLTVTVTGVRFETTRDYAFQATPTRIALPLGIAELGIPGTTIGPPAAAISGVCRSNLLTVDGHPVSVALGGTTQAALAGDGLTVTPCGPDAAGITLGPGSHVVLGAPGSVTGFDVDQLALDSAPGGGPDARTGGAGAPLSAPAPGRAPTVRVTSASTTRYQLRVTGVTRPYWLVLGQSINKGWKASVDGDGRSLGPATLIDGFGNGWLVQPDGAHTMSVTLRWTPQTGENVALLVSAVAVLSCLFLVLVPRRRRRAPRHGPAPAVTAAAFSAVAVGTEGGEDPEGGDVPTLGNPFGRARSLSPGVAAILAAVCGLGAGVLVPQAVFFEVFLGVAAGVALALIVPRARGLLSLAVLGFTVGGVLYIISLQSSQRFASGAWPTHFEQANILIWVAVVFLGADGVVELIRRRRRGGPGPPP
jgi:hypothetical protein